MLLLGFNVCQGNATSTKAQHKYFDKSSAQGCLVRFRELEAFGSVLVTKLNFVFVFWLKTEIMILGFT
jgi:hypothetical protein